MKRCLPLIHSSFRPFQKKTPIYIRVYISLSYAGARTFIRGIQKNPGPGERAQKGGPPEAAGPRSAPAKPEHDGRRKQPGGGRHQSRRGTPHVRSRQPGQAHGDHFRRSRTGYDTAAEPATAGMESAVITQSKPSGQTGSTAPYRIHRADAFKWLSDAEPNSIQAVVTNPPMRCDPIHS